MGTVLAPTDAEPGGVTECGVPTAGPGHDNQHGQRAGTASAQAGRNLTPTPQK